MKDGAAGETLHRPACLPSEMRHRQYILELVVLLINRLFFGLILNTVICLILRKIECKLVSVLGHLFNLGMRNASIRAKNSTNFMCMPCIFVI